MSNLHASAATETERSIYLSAGEAMYAIWQGTAFNVSYFLGFIALVTISLVMLKSTVFSKKMFYLGLTAGGLMAVP